MDYAETIAKAQDAVTVRRVYGEPYEQNGVMLIPAARVAAAAPAVARPRAKAVPAAAVASAWQPACRCRRVPGPRGARAPAGSRAPPARRAGSSGGRVRTPSKISEQPSKTLGLRSPDALSRQRVAPAAERSPQAGIKVSEFSPSRLPYADGPHAQASVLSFAPREGLPRRLRRIGWALAARKQGPSPPVRQARV